MEEFYPFSSPSWIAIIFPSSDALMKVMTFNEAIMEAMVSFEHIRVDMHYRSSFVPWSVAMEASSLSTNSFKDRHANIFQSQTPNVFSKGNLANIYLTIAIKIFDKLKIIENNMIGSNCSPQEIGKYTTLFK